MLRLVTVLSIAAMCGACGPAFRPVVHYSITPSGNAAQAQPRASGCAFDVLRVVPPRPFEELGGLVVDEAPTEAAVDAIQFRAAISDQVCATGGDAVIAQIDRHGGYLSGTIIHYTAPTNAPQ